MRLLVIGGVAAGLSAASRARRIDASMEITVLEKGPVISYGACGLPYWMEGQVRRAEELVTYTPEFFRRERNIDVRTGAEVAAISPHKRQVTLVSGETLRWDKLVIATGARVERREGGFVLQNMEDAERLRAYLERTQPARAVVVGAGYIGLELVTALRARGWRVTLLDRGSYLLKPGDSALTQALRDHLARHRVEVQLGPYEFVPTAELTIHATGFAPNVTLAQQAGVDLGPTGAIRVTDRMETNLASVYAAGDCAETVNLVSGAPAWIPLGTTANKMGRVAGANAAGRRERFAGVVGTSIVRVCGLGVGVAGLSEAEAKQAGMRPVSARVEALDRAKYFHGRKTVVELVASRSDGRLLGATVLGYHGVEGRINVVAAALQSRMTVEKFLEIDLAYAPPFAPVADPLLLAARRLGDEI